MEYELSDRTLVICAEVSHYREKILQPFSHAGQSVFHFWRIRMVVLPEYDSVCFKFSRERLRRISSFHLLPIKLTVVATGQSGSSDFVFIFLL